MVAPVPAHISKLPPRLPAAALPSTPSVTSVFLTPCPLCCAFPRLTPLFPITSLQPQQFHSITHSFAQRHAAIPPIFNGFRTLSITTEVYPSIIPRRTHFQASNASTLLFTKAWCLFVVSLRSFLHPFPLLSTACSLFFQNTGGGVSRANLRDTRVGGSSASTQRPLRLSVILPLRFGSLLRTATFGKHFQGLARISGQVPAGGAPASLASSKARSGKEKFRHERSSLPTH
jgi:hypothetical protein